MSNSTIPAEIEAPPGRERHAAAALQRLGFRVLHIGTTVSTTGPAELWTRHFGVAFTATGDEIAPGRATVPADLGDSITDVHFVAPPEFY